MLIPLSPHANTPCVALNAIVADIMREAGELMLTFTLTGALTNIKGGASLNALTLGQRADNLWLTTCLECFLRPTGQSQYLEINISPDTGDWSTYDFTAYRDGMAPSPATLIDLSAAHSGGRAIVTAKILLPATYETAALDCAVTAVIEEASGQKSYWALAHPGEQPDFHDQDAFIHALPAS